MHSTFHDDDDATVVSCSSAVSMNDNNDNNDTTTTDTISTMLLQQDFYWQPLDISRYSHVTDATWRQRIIEWMYGVVDTCRLRRDVVAVAVHYLDASLDLLASRADFQLAAMTSLQLAIKLYDSTILKVSSMVQLGRGLFTVDDIVTMETRILQHLRWKVHPPTTLCFLRQYTLPSQDAWAIQEMTRFQSEIATCLYTLRSFQPSELATAALDVARRQLGVELHVPTPNLDCVHALEATLANNASWHELLQSLSTQPKRGLQRTYSPRDVATALGQY